MKNIFFILLILMILLVTYNLKSEYYDGLFIIINNDVITLNEFKESFKKFKAYLLRAGQPLPPNAMQFVFNNQISEKIIQQVADRKEIFVSDMEVEEAINRIKIMNRMSDEVFNEALSREGKNLKELEEESRKQLLNEKIMSLELRPRIVPSSDEEIKEYYMGNKDKMYSPPQIRVSHILKRDNPNASLLERSKIKQEIQDILNKALRGENFEKLAKEFSEDAVSAPLGGDIGFITEGEWLPELDKIIFKLPKNEIAKTLLPSRQGWHIIKITDYKPKMLIPFKDMKSRIDNFLIQQKMQKEYEKWLEEQKQNAYFEVILPGDEKYVFDFDKWKKKGSEKIISNEEFLKKLNLIKID